MSTREVDPQAEGDTGAVIGGDFRTRASSAQTGKPPELPAIFLHKGFCSHRTLFPGRLHQLFNNRAQ